MTRLVPLTLRDGTNFALNAHLVTSVSELQNGFVRIFVDDGDYYEVPGTVAQIAALISDPPVQAVRFVKLGDRYVNPALVAWICASCNGREVGSQIWFSAREDGDCPSGADYIQVNGTPAEVAAKLEGRAP